MGSEALTELYEKAIKRLRDEGTRFTVDDLASDLKVSKKSIYAHFPSKEALALWIYEKAFEDFSTFLSDAKDDVAVASESALFLSYADLLSITSAETFNRYSLNPTLKERALMGMEKARELMREYIEIEFPVLMKHASFFSSFEASLRALDASPNRAELIDDFRFMLEGTRC